MTPAGGTVQTVRRSRQRGISNSDSVCGQRVRGVGRTCSAKVLPDLILGDVSRLVHCPRLYLLPPHWGRVHVHRWLILRNRIQPCLRATALFQEALFARVGFAVLAPSQLGAKLETECRSKDHHQPDCEDVSRCIVAGWRWCWGTGAVWSRCSVTSVRPNSHHHCGDSCVNRGLA